MSCRRRLCWILAVAIVIVAGSASGATPEAGARDDAIRGFVADLQHIPGDELPRADLEIEPGARAAWRITRQEAIEDAERFFYLLSHGWCGYEYFRTTGDSGASGLDPFAEAKRALLLRLDEKQRWSSDSLSDLIHEHLAFVRDCHLNLNDEPFCRHQDFWFDPHLELREEDGTIRFTLDGESHQLLEIDGASPEPHLFSSIDAAGNAIMMMGTLSATEPEPPELTARRKDGEVRLRRSLSRSDLQRGERFAEERIGGIPVVRLPSFADYYGRELSAIVDRAQTYRGEPYVILDIRGNGGGNTIWPRRWITAFTGGSPSLKQALSELVNRTTMTGRANIFALMMRAYRKQERAAVQVDFDRFRHAAAYFDDPAATPYWSEIAVPVVEPISNRTTLIVIQDREVASAGESLVSYLYDQVENVVFVGENTMGALTFGQQSAHRLPNSKLLAYVPIKLNAPLDLVFREERGFTPDYWVPGPQALNHAVAAARAGTIPTAVPLPAGYFDVEFVPERPLPWWRVHRRDLLLGTYFLALGAVFGIVNRKKKTVVFLIAGVVSFALCAGYVFFGSPAGYAFGVVGLSYLVIGLVKRGKQS